MFQHPARFFAGDSVVLRIPAAEFDGSLVDSSAWGLDYVLIGNGQNLSAVGSTDGTGWVVTLDPAATATWPSGFYSWTIALTEMAGQSRHFTLQAGGVEILASLATISNTFPGFSQLRQDIAAIDAAIRARITGGAVAEYTILGRNLKYETIGALRKLRSDLLLEYQREQSAANVAAGLGSGKRIGVRFV